MTGSNIKTVKIAFRGNMESLYSFFTDIKLEPQDVVLCDTATGPSVGKVVSVSDDLDSKAEKWIIQKIDYAAFQKTLYKRNRQVAEERKRREEEDLADLLG